MPRPALTRRRRFQRRNGRTGVLWGLLYKGGHGDIPSPWPPVTSSPLPRLLPITLLTTTLTMLASKLFALATFHAVASFALAFPTTQKRDVEQNVARWTKFDGGMTAW